MIEHTDNKLNCKMIRVMYYGINTKFLVWVFAICQFTVTHMDSFRQVGSISHLDN